MNSEPFIHERATIIGNVTLGEGTSVWPGAVIRGDLSPISVGRCSSVQDTVVIHCDRVHGVAVGDFVTIGHGAVIHGSTISDMCVIGMNAVIQNGASVGEGSIIASGTVLNPGSSVPPLSLAIGNPPVIKEGRYNDCITPLESAVIYYGMSRLMLTGANITDKEADRIYREAGEEAKRIQHCIDENRRNEIFSFINVV